VAETTASDLFDHLDKSCSDRVVWNHPENPFFSQIDKQNTALLLGTAAPALQIEETLRKAANLDDYLVAHDTRRGGAREIFLLKGVTVPDN
jgi:hypothetical protein